MRRPRKPASLFRYFNSSPEVIRLVVMMYVRFPLSLRNVEDLLFERGIDICHETVRHWWNRFDPMFAGDIRRQRVSCMRGLPSGSASYFEHREAGAAVSYQASSSAMSSC
jgi:putative transposase